MRSFCLLRGEAHNRIAEHFEGRGVVLRDMAVLSRSRRPWRRAEAALRFEDIALPPIATALWRHRRIIFNPRFGALGMLAMPYFLIFDFLGPVVEVAGPAITIAA